MSMIEQIGGREGGGARQSFCSYANPAQVSKFSHGQD